MSSVKKSEQKKETKILSIDVGQKNLAIRFEGRTLDPNHVNVLLFDLIDITTNGKTINSKLIQLNSELEKRKRFFDQGIDTLLIEKQIKQAVVNVRIMNHIESWFLIFYPDIKIVEFDPKLRCQELTETRKSYAERNRLTVEKAYEICKSRNDLSSVSKLDVEKKKDDLSVTIVQLDIYYNTGKCKTTPKTKKTKKT